MFYELTHSLNPSDLQFNEGDRLPFPSHLHGSFEFIVITSGECTVTVDKKVYRVTPEAAVLVFPNQVHSMESPTPNTFFSCIFSSGYVKAFSEFAYQNLPVSNLFTLPQDLLDDLRTLRREDRLVHIKSTLYRLVDCFDRTAEYQCRGKSDETLLAKIFDYVRNHYNADCSLQLLSTTLNYHYSYLSRLFSEQTGMSFTEYVNRFRIHESCYFLTNTDKSITQIAFDCGYNSLRSFYRNFMEQIGETPGEFRQRHYAFEVIIGG